MVDEEGDGLMSHNLIRKVECWGFTGSLDDQVMSSARPCGCREMSQIITHASCLGIMSRRNTFSHDPS